MAARTSRRGSVVCGRIRSGGYCERGMRVAGGNEQRRPSRPPERQGTPRTGGPKMICSCSEITTGATCSSAQVATIKKDNVRPTALRDCFQPTPRMTRPRQRTPPSTSYMSTTQDWADPQAYSQKTALRTQQHHGAEVVSLLRQPQHLSPHRHRQ